MEILAFGIFGWYLEAISARRSIAATKQRHRPMWEAATEILSGQAQVLPFVIDGIVLMRVHGSGFYWVAAGGIAISFFSTMNAWALLVEILR
jgi:hypothetical protein